MGRLIDVDSLILEQQSLEDVGQGVMEFYSKEQIDQAPTIEAIPKADYESRLKDDLVAILTEIQNEIQKYSGCSCTCSDGVVDDIDDLIQEKIDKLKGEQNV